MKAHALHCPTARRSIRGTDASGRKPGCKRVTSSSLKRSGPKGFARPLRRTYTHLKCGTDTAMGQTIAETYARDPHFYSGTFCCGCGTHFPVGENGEFVWSGTNEKVGT